MEFVITFNQPADVIELHEDPVRGPAALEPWKAYMGELVAAGVMRGGNRLAPPWTATTVRVRDGQRLVVKPFKTRFVGEGGQKIVWLMFATSLLVRESTAAPGAGG